MFEGLQRVHRSRDLHVHTDSKWSSGIILLIKRSHDKQWRTATRQKLMNCDTWATVYDVLQQRTGQTLWSNMAITNVPLTAKRMHRLSKSQQRTHCNQGHVYYDDRGSPWLPRGRATSGQKEMQKAQQSDTQFGFAARGDTAQTEGAFGPLGIVQC